VNPSDPSPWRGFEIAVEQIKRLRGSTDRRIALSWKLRMDSQIAHCYGAADWLASARANELSDLVALGDDIGIHIHPVRFLPSGDSVADFSDPERVVDEAAGAMDVYEGSFGHRPRVASIGHNWHSNETVALFERRGIVVDLTLEHGTTKLPFYDGVGMFRGQRDSFERVPAQPYRPSRMDYRVPSADDRAIWMIPLSSVPAPDGRSRTKARLTAGLSDIGSLLQIRTPVIALAIRSSDFIAPAARQSIVAGLQLICHDENAELVTPLEAIERTQGSEAISPVRADDDR
jgi:hypothetical protein